MKCIEVFSITESCQKEVQMLTDFHNSECSKCYLMKQKEL